MEHSLLPIDICEEIIDACSQEHFLRSCYQTLSACALTCKRWHPRSRYNLFQRVRFRHPYQIKRFLETITTQPFLADFVVELHITPAEAHRHGFFPFADPLLVQKLHSVQKLALRQFQWISLPPRYTSIYIGKYTSVTCLEVHNNVFNSGGDLIRLVWHLPELTQLSCGLNTFTMTSSAENLESLCALQKSRPSACRKLYILKLWSLDRYPPIIKAFGSLVVYLRLDQPDASWPWANICDSVEDYQHLRSISLSFIASEHALFTPVHSPSTVLGSDLGSRQNPFCHIKDQVTRLVQRIRSDYMHTISVRLSPSLGEQDKDGTRSFTYHSNRMQAIGLLFGQEFGQLMSYGSLRSLAVLHVHLQENDLKYHAQWWCDTIRASVGTVPKEIRVDVDYYCPSSPRGRYTYERLWLD